MEPLRKPPVTLPHHAQGKAAAGLVSTHQTEEGRFARKKHDEAGLVGFVNIGNSCYMNATLQALSNCPPFCQYFVDTFQPSPSSSAPISAQSAATLSSLLKKVWSADRHPGHLSPRSVSSAMRSRTFRGSQQQDAQEFLRCLLTQIHEELGVQVPPPDEGTRGRGQRESMVSCDSDTSADSQCSQSRLVASTRHSPLIKKRSTSSSSLSRLKLPGPAHKLTGSAHSSPGSLSKFSLKYSRIITPASAKSSVESIPTQLMGVGQGVGPRELQEEGMEWEEVDVFLADVIDGKVTVHRKYLSPPVHLKDSPVRSHDLSHGKSCDQSCDEELANQITCVDDSLSSSSVSSGRVSLQEEAITAGLGTTPLSAEVEDMTTPLSTEGENAPPLATGEPEVVVESPRNSANDEDPEGRSQVGGNALPTGTEAPPRGTTTSNRTVHQHPRTTSIVSEVFEGVLESRVQCSKCKRISETREPFQDLSLPIPGRKEIAKFNSKQESSVVEEDGGDKESESGTISRGFCSVWNYVSLFTRDLFVGPPTDLDNCLNAFFDTSYLKGENRYYCVHCKSFQDSLQEMSIVSLPEVLCIHLKRFRYDAYISTNKISRHIRFPLVALNMAPFLKQGSAGAHLYDLNAVITHYGGAGAGHYVAFAKNSQRNSWYEFNDTRVYPVGSDSVLNAEGYVLFYRRSDSSAIQPMDITSLLPRSGITLPSPDVCYISRHWLHLVKHHTRPGAILQYDFACGHGAVLPTLSMEDAHALALCIRRDVWEEFQQQYGGGPLVQRLEICKDCKEMLSQLNKRRKAEKDEVQKVHTKEKRGIEDKKRDCFLIFLPWLQQWQKFIHCTTLEWRPPVAMDNTPLLQRSGTAGKRTLTLTKGAPFRKISQEVWELFQRWYGGGPVIVTSLEPIKSSNV